MNRESWTSFNLIPDDVLFFRDGKPSSRGADHYLRSLFPPYPSTVYGALRTRRLLDEGVPLLELAEGSWSERLRGLTAELGDWGGFGSLELRGPWLVLDDEPLLPAPADLGITLEEGTGQDEPPKVKSVARFRLSPNQDGGGWTHPLGMLATPEGSGDPRPAEGWYLRPSGLDAWRRGSDPLPKDFVHPQALWKVEARTGVGLEEDRRASKQGLLYTFGFLRLLQAVALGFETAGSALQPDGRVRLGGEGRTAALETGRPFPTAPAEIEGDRLCLSFATPAISTRGGYPPGFAEDRLEGEVAGRRLRLVAAALPGLVTVGGWDLARHQPKPLRRAIPAGSVFLFEPVDGGKVRPADFDGIRLSDYDDEGLAQQGFGLAVAGLSL